MCRHDVENQYNKNYNKYKIISQIKGIKCDDFQLYYNRLKHIDQVIVKLITSYNENNVIILLLFTVNIVHLISIIPQFPLLKNDGARVPKYEYTAYSFSTFIIRPNVIC